MSITSEDELEGMKRAGAGVAAALAAMKAAVEPGVTSAQLNDICGDVFAEHGAVSAPRLEYGAPVHAFVSVNADVVHGLPTDRPLEPGTEYAFTVTSSLRDADGQAFAPFVSTFTTGNTSGGCTDDCDITVVPQPAAADERHSSLAFGPDGNLYATTIIGEVKRYPVGSDGTLGSPTTITSLLRAEGGPRLTVGLAFDPASTPDNLVAWVTHTEIGEFNNGEVRPGIDAPWMGKLTRLSGPNLETVEDVVINLPRSNKDHVTNLVAFNPAEPGVVYFVQGSNTAMGAPDRTWGYQEERALSGAVLRLDTNLLGSNLPLNAQTEDGGTYDPFAPGTPLTVYASSTRNSYDLVWHSSDHLYVPANGSNYGGVVPRYDPIPGTYDNRIDGGPYTGETLDIDSPGDVNGEYTTGDDEGETDGWTVGETQQDYLFRIEQGGYYGTPNPKRCEWVLFGGGTSPLNDRVPEYPDSVEPDPNYRGFAYDFGKNVSPNGALEYRGDAFPDLKDKLLVTRYSNGDDVVAVSFDGDGDVVGEATPIVPSRSFGDPIDIAEDPDTGLLYVSSYDEVGTARGGAGIALLRPEQNVAVQRRFYPYRRTPDIGTDSGRVEHHKGRLKSCVRSYGHA